MASLVQPNTALDKEAALRGATTYVFKSYHMTMLPHDLNGVKCSLIAGQPRMAVTLSVMMNDEGIMDLSSARYELTRIKNTVKLSYNAADKLINNEDEETLYLKDKLS